MNSSKSSPLKYLAVFIIVTLLICSVPFWCVPLQASLGRVVQDQYTSDGPLTRPGLPAHVDFSQLPAEPTEQDYLRLAISVIERETQTQGFVPHSVAWYGVPCGASIYQPAWINVGATWQEAFNATHVRSVAASMTFDFQRAANYLTIGDRIHTNEESPTPTPSPFKWDKLAWHVDEVFALAEAQGGEAYRQQIQDQCAITLLVDDDTFFIWRVRYEPIADGKPYFCATLNYDTGEMIAEVSAIRCKTPNP